MKKLTDLLYRYPILREFIKYCFVGFANFTIDLLVYTLLTRVFDVYYVVASAGAFVVAVSWSFYANKKWTFRHYQNHHKNVLLYSKFFISNTVSMLCGLLVLYVLVDHFFLYDIYAKVFTAMGISILNFLLNKYWTFDARAEKIAYCLYKNGK